MEGFNSGKMPAFELKKTLENEYHSILKIEKLKGISFKVFHSLEEVVKSYENLIPQQQEYNDQSSAWKSYYVRGRLTYKSSQEDKSVLTIELKGGVKKNSSGLIDFSYNKVDILLRSDTKEVDTNVVIDLVNKFKSFEDLIQKSQERMDRLIFSEL